VSAVFSGLLVLLLEDALQRLAGHGAGELVHDKHIGDALELGAQYAILLG
jgi:hypothetical protein